MKKSQRLRFIDLARRQESLNTTEKRELADLHALAIKFNDPSKDIDDLPKPAVVAPKGAVSEKDFGALTEQVAELSAALSETNDAAKALESRVAALEAAAKK